MFAKSQLINMVLILFFTFSLVLESLHISDCFSQNLEQDQNEPYEEENSKRIRLVIKEILDIYNSSPDSTTFYERIKNENISLDSLINDNRMNLNTQVEIKRRIVEIREIILETAAQLELGEDFQVKFNEDRFQIAILDGPANLDSLETRTRLNNVSIRSLALALSYIEILSSTLYEEIKKENDMDRKIDLAIEYTSFVYVFTDIVIQIIESFELPKSDNLRESYLEKEKELLRLKQLILGKKEKLYKLFDNNNLDLREYKETMIDLNLSLDLLDELSKEWQESYLTIEEQEEWVKDLKSKILLHERTKESAALQLQLLTIAGDIQDNKISFSLDIPEIPEPPPLVHVNRSLIERLQQLQLKLEEQIKIQN